MSGFQKYFWSSMKPRSWPSRSQSPARPATQPSTPPDACCRRSSTFFLAARALRLAWGSLVALMPVWTPARSRRFSLLSTRDPRAGQARWQRGHQQAVRPATVAFRRRLPQRGQRASLSSRTRVSQSRPCGTRPVGMDSRMHASTASWRRSRRLLESSGTGVRGFTRARQRISSVSRLPSPASSLWSIRAALTAPRREQRVEVVAGKLLGIRPQPAGLPTDLSLVARQPDRAEPPHVAVHQLAGGAQEHDSVVGVAPLAAPHPLEQSRHPEVHQHPRLPHWSYQPLAVALRLAEALAAHGVAESPRRGALQHVAVQHLDRGDPLADGVGGEDAPEALHVRQLRHVSGLRSRPASRPTARRSRSPGASPVRTR